MFKYMFDYSKLNEEGSFLKKQDICEVTCDHKDPVNRVHAVLNKVDTAEVAKLFKALSDETRVKIAYALSLEEELCVCDIANIVKSSIATASHHLRLLRDLGLAKNRKEGKLVYYSIKNLHVKQFIQLAFDHQRER